MWSLVLGLIPGLANTLSAWVTARGNEELAKVGADKEVALGHLAAVTAANQARASIIQLPWVKWLMFALYMPCIAHQTGIVLGRMHLIDWDMMPVDNVELAVLMTLVIYVPAAKMVGR